MVPVVTKAEPTELVLALTTCHVHAALVFLNRTLAFRAGLCINLHPVVGVLITFFHAIFPHG